MTNLKNQLLSVSFWMTHTNEITKSTSDYCYYNWNDCQVREDLLESFQRIRLVTESRIRNEV